MDPVDVWTSTDSASLIIIPFSDFGWNRALHSLQMGRDSVNLERSQPPPGEQRKLVRDNHR